MKYIKPELKVEMIEIKENIAGFDGWLKDNEMSDAGVTKVFVERMS